MGASVVAVVAAALACTAGTAWAAEPPHVNKLDQRQGPEVGRLSVAVRGSNLSGASAVEFGGVPAESFLVENGGGEIRAVSPPGTGVVDVTVTTPAGTSEIVPGDEFTYRATPEWGRCISVGGGNGGNFRAAGCQSEEASGEDPRAVFEWFPGFEGSRPLTKLGLTFVASKGWKLETPEGTKFSCASAGGAGEITGPTTMGFASIALSGCTSKLGKTTASCHGPSLAEGEVQTAALDGQMGITELNPKTTTKDQAGVELSAAGETIAEFSCGGTPVMLRGPVILDMKKPNKRTEKVSWKAAASKGVQKFPTSFWEQAPVGLEVKIGEGAYEPIALTIKATGATEEALIFNTKV